MKAAELRQAILQAAVQGKLVPQDLHDEPADKLLARIRAEKLALIKEGKIKKEKPLPPIAEDEVPYDLPDGWVWCRIGDLCSVRGGKRIPKGMSFSRQETQHIYIRVTDMKNGSISDQKLVYIDDAVFKHIQQYTISSDDVYVTIAGTIGQCGIVPSKFHNMNLTENAAKLCNIIQVDKQYIVYAISSCVIQEQFAELTNQMAQPKLALKRIISTYFPLPPLAEQHRIVAKVDELMALCDELEATEGELEALEKHFAEYLPKSILQYAVQGKLVPQDLHDEPASELLARIRAEKAALIKAGKLKKEKPLPPIAEDEIPYDLPGGWVWCRLGDVGTFVRGNGIKRSDVSSHGVPCIRYGEIYTTYNIFADKAVSFVEESVATKSVSLKRGDVLMTLTGENKEEIGKAVAFLGEENTVIGGDLATFTNHYQNPMYLSYFMNSPFALLQKAKTATGNIIVHISCDKLSMIPFPLPPLAEQQRIIAKVDELMTLCDELKVAKTLPVEKQIAKIIEFPKPAEPDTKLAFAARGDADNISKEAMDDIAELLGEFDDG